MYARKNTHRSSQLLLLIWFMIRIHILFCAVCLCHNNIVDIPIWYVCRQQRLWTISHLQMHLLSRGSDAVCKFVMRWQHTAVNTQRLGSGWYDFPGILVPNCVLPTGTQCRSSTTSALDTNDRQYNNHTLEISISSSQLHFKQPAFAWQTTISNEIIRFVSRYNEILISTKHPKCVFPISFLLRAGR